MLALLLVASVAIPRAIITDPPHDAKHPAAMVVLHIPSGGVNINGVAYVAQGAGPHPTLVLLHGHPGNEKNLDLAQAARRAGWNAITFNYRGSWGSPGAFRFAQTLEDASAALAYLRDAANAKSLRVDTSRIVLGGHSMGGWVTALVASRDHALRGAILISPANIVRHSFDRAQAIEHMRDNMESLAGTTPEQMADEVIANREAFDWNNAVAGLTRTPLLVVTSDDGLAPAAMTLANAVRKAGSARVTTKHIATDHAYSDRRIALETEVIRWLSSID